MRIFKYFDYLSFITIKNMSFLYLGTYFPIRWRHYICGNWSCSNRKRIQCTPLLPTSPSYVMVYSLPIPLFFSREVNGLFLFFISIKSRATWHREDIRIGGRQGVRQVRGMVRMPRMGRVQSVRRKLCSLSLRRGLHDAAARATQAAASG